MGIKQKVEVYKMEREEVTEKMGFMANKGWFVHAITLEPTNSPLGHPAIWVVYRRKSIKGEPSEHQRNYPSSNHDLKLSGE